MWPVLVSERVIIFTQTETLVSVIVLAEAFVLFADLVDQLMGKLAK